MRGTKRSKLLQVHRWTGLILGPLLLYMALTGLALEFREQLKPLAEPAPSNTAGCEAPHALPTQVAAALAAQPGIALTSLILQGGPGEPTLLRFADGQQLSVDPCGARVIARQPRWGGLFGRLEQFHRFRFLDDNQLANTIAGSIALVLALLMVVGGLALWWPRGQALKAAATLRPQLKGRAFALNLHRVSGLYASVVLLAVTLTSLPLAFQWARSALDVAVGSKAPAPRPSSSAPAPGANPLDLGLLWERGRAVFNRPSLVVVTAARKAGDPVEVYAVEHGAPHPQALSYAWFDAYSGALLRSESYAESSLGNRIYLTAGAIHGGEYGLLLQWLQFIGVLAVPVLAWTGVSSVLRGRSKPVPGLRVRVQAIGEEALGIKSFELVSADGRPLPAFEAGAHVGVHLENGLVRQYSLCNDPAERARYLIAVKRSDTSRGGSAAMHEQVRVGDVLTIDGPRNNFPLAAGATHQVLLAAGIGITPLLGMAQHLQGRGASFELHYLAHSQEHVAFAELLRQPRFEGRVHIHYSMGSERLQQWLGRLLAVHASGHHLYLCGSNRFMEAVQQVAAAASWPAEAIHVEHFGADTKLVGAPCEPFELHLRRSGRTLQVPADRSIVEVLDAAGVPVPTSCREGVCGTCSTRVIEGRCEHRDAFLSPAEHAAGDRIITCVSRASGRLVLDL
ncbi:PepSY domain-containing protein [Paucibacter sp. JuS9]|uniref:PepSY domain-containing protein n=1 Tax=Paucibacter sp. JuS9 TaxID=3228748 RepID=UPI003756E667